MTFLGAVCCYFKYDGEVVGGEVIYSFDCVFKSNVGQEYVQVRGFAVELSVGVSRRVED